MNKYYELKRGIEKIQILVNNLGYHIAEEGMVMNIQTSSRKQAIKEVKEFIQKKVEEGFEIIEGG